MVVCMDPPELKPDRVDHLIECFKEDLTELTDSRRCLFFREADKDYKGFMIDAIEVMVDFKSTIPTQDEVSNIFDLIEESLNRSDILYSFISHEVDGDPWVYDMGDERIYQGQNPYIFNDPSYSLRITIGLS